MERSGEGGLPKQGKEEEGESNSPHIFQETRWNGREKVSSFLRTMALFVLSVGKKHVCAFADFDVVEMKPRDNFSNSNAGVTI